MSSIYIKNVNIINPFSEEPLEERHVLIENGRIKSLHTEESSLYKDHIVIEMDFTKRIS